jgi:hypothetical protein
LAFVAMIVMVRKDYFFKTTKGKSIIRGALVKLGICHVFKQLFSFVADEEFAWLVVPVYFSSIIQRCVCESESDRRLDPN